MYRFQNTISMLSFKCEETIANILTSLSFRLSSFEQILDRQKQCLVHQFSINVVEMFSLEKLPLRFCFQLTVCICNHENKETKSEIIYIRLRICLNILYLCILPSWLYVILEHEVSIRQHCSFQIINRNRSARYTK